MLALPALPPKVFFAHPPHVLGHEGGPVCCIPRWVVAPAAQHCDLCTVHRGARGACQNATRGSLPMIGASPWSDCAPLLRLQISTAQLGRQQPSISSAPIRRQRPWHGPRHPCRRRQRGNGHDQTDDGWCRHGFFARSRQGAPPRARTPAIAPATPYSVCRRLAMRTVFGQLSPHTAHD